MCSVCSKLCKHVPAACLVQVARRLAAWQERNPSCQVLLVPSVRDVHLQPVFPQPPVPLEGGLGERLRSLQNPCAFASEGLVVAASSQDVLKHLVGCEVARGQQAQDSMAARASHLVGQRRCVAGGLEGGGGWGRAARCGVPWPGRQMQQRPAF